jgi:response regulator RpfG family c-di-GMP phosphodiesterase
MRNATYHAKLTGQRRRKVLLVDRNDSRRDARQRLLADAGYEVETSEDYFQEKGSEKAGPFDLVIVALHREDLNDAAAYSERLRQSTPPVPILLLTDVGVFVPRYALSHCIHAGHPVELLAEIAEMLAAHEADPEARPVGKQLKAS